MVFRVDFLYMRSPPPPPPPPPASFIASGSQAPSDDLICDEHTDCKLAPIAWIADLDAHGKQNALRWHAVDSSMCSCISILRQEV